MKALRTFAFGALALFVASFATTTQANADNFGIYIGSNGFGIQVSNHGGYGGGGCYDPYYRAYVACGYSNYYPRSYYSGYYSQPRFHHRRHRFVPYGWHGNFGHHWDARQRHGWQGHRGWSHAGWSGVHHGFRGGRGHHGGRRH